MNNFFSKHILKIVFVISFIFLFTLIGILSYGYDITKKRLSSCSKDSNNTYSYFDKELSNKNKQITELKQIASTTKEQYQSCVESLPDYIEFTSKNKRLKFLYNKNWICREMVTDYRVDCYPVSRQTDEYDMGLDQPGVYFADITMRFSGFQKVGNNIPESPVKVVKEDVGTFYDFYKNFNGVEVIITAQNPEINTEKKLYNILH